MASSIRPVARIWLSAPSSSHGQNAAVGHGTWSPVAANTIAKKTTENGKQNKKRILVAPQVPSGPVNCRCIALRATCPSAAVMVKGIQSVVMENMGGCCLHPPLADPGGGGSARIARPETGWGDGLSTRAAFEGRDCHPPDRCDRPSPS